MIYQSVSMKSVIGRVIRNTRLQDTSYIADMHDWLYEAMGMLETRQSTSGKAEDITISFHKGKLPCGLRWLDAVEYNGCRLHLGNSVRPVSREVVLSQPTDGLSVFATQIDKIVPVENHLLWSSTLAQVNRKPLSTSNFYEVEMGYISTSMCDAVVTVYFRAVPTDKDGLPLIPDNENYKQALYFYARAQLIGSGYPDKVFSYEQCEQRFEHYGARALGEISYPSPDEMENIKNTLVRFIPPPNYWENFFRAGEEGFFETSRL
jgi:hypothetical protein